MFDIVFLKLGLKKVCHKNFFFQSFHFKANFIFACTTIFDLTTRFTYLIKSYLFFLTFCLKFFFFFKLLFEINLISYIFHKFRIKVIKNYIFYLIFSKKKYQKQLDIKWTFILTFFLNHVLKIHIDSCIT